MPLDKETSEAAQRVINGTPGYAGMYPGTHFCLCWGEPGVGWGEVHFSVREGTDQVIMHTESMSKEFVKKMVCRMIDNAEIED
jgi:hypothetical protein